MIFVNICGCVWLLEENKMTDGYTEMVIVNANTEGTIYWLLEHGFEYVDQL